MNASDPSAPLRRTLWWATAVGRPQTHPLTDGLSVDVAVVGGGFLGMTAAWRLAAAFVEATRGDRTAPQSLPATASLPSLASPAAASALSASPLAPPPLPSPPPTRSPEDRR